MKEEQEYIDSIEADVRWLGFDWGEHLYFASDYFEQLYEWAVDLIKAGKAYVDDLSADEIREHRGTFTEPGTDSPWRDRPVEENLDLFARMRAGEFPDGARVLRAKIDMAVAQHQPARPGAVPHPARGAPAHGRRLVRLPHLRLRPRAVRRDRGHHALHLHARVRGAPAALRLAHREPAGAVGAAPVRVRAPQPHAHRALQARAAAPRQRGVRARLGRPAHAHACRRCAAAASPPRASATSRRWSALPRRTTPSRSRCSSTPCATCSTARRSRRFAVLDPLKVVIENYPEGQTEEMEVPNNPEDPSAGTRKVAFSRELWIERDDFMEEPVRKFFRLAPGREVRLRSAYFVTCDEVVKDAAGEIVELRCTYDPATRGGDAPDGRRPKATLHWLSAAHAVPAEVRLYDHLFRSPYPGVGRPRHLRGRRPGLRDRAARLLRGAVARRPAGRRDRAVRAARLLLPGPRLGAGRARVQPHASRSRTPGPSCRSRGGRTDARRPDDGARGAAKRPLKRDSSRRRRLSEPPPRGRLSTSLASGLIGKAPDSGSGD